MWLTIQTHHGGAWHDAATVELERPGDGTRGASAVEYDLDYFAETASVDLARGVPAIDARAVSVLHPVDLVRRHSRRWPAFLPDMLPQGPARATMARRLGMPPDTPAAETRILHHAGGAPVGNLRIKEAHERERERLEGVNVPGLTLDGILCRDSAFAEVAERFGTAEAAGARGLQGEWPKMALTLSSDGLWYPDPVVPDGEARDHVIVKWLLSPAERDRMILAAEAPYLEIARAFGLRVGRPAIHRDGTLVVPRFDRRITPAGVVRLGQESLLSATGAVDNERNALHEDHLDAARERSRDRARTTVEYVLRDLLGLALGHLDNHGRNIALAKDAGGSVELAPVFDLTPSRLSPDGSARSTRWGCLGRGGDYAPDWRTVCEAAAEGVMDAEALAAELVAREAFVRDLPARAAAFGLDPETARVAFRCAEMADGLAELAGTMERGRSPRR